ncbi:hypothetical protein R83H12_01513 [Fibrobacteria bacterium R8-3-H12]
MNFATYNTSKQALKKAGAAVLKNGGICGGFTLIELIVYMAIMGFIIVVAGRVFSDSTSMRVRSQNMLASVEEAGRVSALLKEDISQMGTKSFYGTSGNDHIDTLANVHIDFENNNDLSSYILNVENSDFHEITFRKAHYREDGECLAIREVRWYVDGGKLMRACSVINNGKCYNSTHGCNGDAVEIARDVKKFNLSPSKPGTKETAPSDFKEFPNQNDPSESFSIIPQSTPAPAALGTVAPAGVKRYTLSKFTKDVASHFYIAATGASGCKSFSFKAGEIYAIEFQLPCNTDGCLEGPSYNEMVMFQPGRDHLSVGLRNTSMNGYIQDVPDFLFYPPQNKDANSIRHFEFSVPANTNACVGITAVFYSDKIANSGTLDIWEFRVYRTENVYYFPEPPYTPTNNSEKASVKAFKLDLEIEKGGNGQKRGETNKVTTIIPIPNNGVVPAKQGSI